MLPRRGWQPESTGDSPLLGFSCFRQLRRLCRGTALPGRLELVRCSCLLRDGSPRGRRRARLATRVRAVGAIASPALHPAVRAVSRSPVARSPGRPPKRAWRAHQASWGCSRRWAGVDGARPPRRRYPPDPALNFSRPTSLPAPRARRRLVVVAAAAVAVVVVVSCGDTVLLQCGSVPKSGHEYE